VDLAAAPDAEEAEVAAVEAVAEAEVPVFGKQFGFAD
jgi:hypothetical protein